MSNEAIAASTESAEKHDDHGSMTSLLGTFATLIVRRDSLWIETFSRIIRDLVRDGNRIDQGGSGRGFLHALETGQDLQHSDRSLLTGIRSDLHQLDDDRFEFLSERD